MLLLLLLLSGRRAGAGGSQLGAAETVAKGWMQQIPFLCYGTAENGGGGQEGDVQNRSEGNAQLHWCWRRTTGFARYPPPMYRDSFHHLPLAPPEMSNANCENRELLNPLSLEKNVLGVGKTSSEACSALRNTKVFEVEVS